jgi:hypothetical protein
MTILNNFINKNIMAMWNYLWWPISLIHTLTGSLIMKHLIQWFIWFDSCKKNEHTQIYSPLNAKTWKYLRSVILRYNTSYIAMLVHFLTCIPCNEVFLCFMCSIVLPTCRIIPIYPQPSSFCRWYFSYITYRTIIATAFHSVARFGTQCVIMCHCIACVETNHHLLF